MQEIQCMIIRNKLNFSFTQNATWELCHNWPGWWISAFHTPWHNLNWWQTELSEACVHKHFCICYLQMYVKVSFHSVTDTWWRHLMEIFSALLALYNGNPPVTGGFPSQRPVTRSFYMGLSKWLGKQSKRRCFKKQWRSLWRHCNEKTPPAVIECSLVWTTSSFYCWCIICEL